MSQGSVSQASVFAAPFLYAPPSKPSALYAGRLQAFDAIRKLGQGLGSAWLTFSSAQNTATMTVAPAGAAVASDFTSMDGFVQAVLEGRLTGPAQLAAGAVLFLVAGRCTARTLGLGLGLAALYFLQRGASPADVISAAGDLFVRLRAAFDAFMAASPA